MSNNIVLTFSLLFAATIALICAVYVYLGNRRKIKQEEEPIQETSYY